PILCAPVLGRTDPASVDISQLPFVAPASSEPTRTDSGIGAAPTRELPARRRMLHRHCRVDSILTTGAIAAQARPTNQPFPGGYSSGEQGSAAIQAASWQEESARRHRRRSPLLVRLVRQDLDKHSVYCVLWSK